MKLQELLENIDEMKIAQPNKLESWVIKRDGVIIKLPNGKAIWKKQNHASAALTNYVSSNFYWRDLETLREEIGLNRRDSLGKYLLDNKIVTIERL